jgi:YfiH family protein
MSGTGELEFILPDWPAPASVHGCCTTRTGGFSDPPWDSFNLADHVGDDPARVRRNRQLLQEALGLPAEPVWLRQVHGQVVCDASDGAGEADGAYARRPGTVCVVLTADCLPVLLCDRSGTRVAALHAGWRGLAGGILEAGVRALDSEPGELLAWLGPAVGPTKFEVGPEVRAQFLRADAGAEQAFTPGAGDRWYADLYQLARRRLRSAGVSAIFGGGHCTVTDAARFFSFRRDGETGRMASLIWMEPPAN